MNFGQALEQLKAGKKIKRAGWGGYWEMESYQLIMDEISSVMIVSHLANGGIAPAQAYQNDILASDWEVVK